MVRSDEIKKDKIWGGGGAGKLGGKRKCIYKFWWEQRQGPLKTPRCRWKDNIKKNELKWGAKVWNGSDYFTTAYNGRLL